MTDPRKNRDAARAALATYTSVPGYGAGDDRENITDLIADLAHLADLINQEYDDDELSGTEVLSSAELHYNAEVDE